MNFSFLINFFLITLTITSWPLCSFSQDNTVIKQYTCNLHLKFTPVYKTNKNGQQYRPNRDIERKNLVVNVYKDAGPETLYNGKTIQADGGLKLQLLFVADNDYSKKHNLDQYMKIYFIMNQNDNSEGLSIKSIEERAEFKSFFPVSQKKIYFVTGYIKESLIPWDDEGDVLLPAPDRAATYMLAVDCDSN